MRLAVLLSTGFTVKESNHSGVSALEDELHRAFDDDDCIIMRRTWDADWHDLGRMFASRTPDRIAFIGHSYGGGVAFPKFAKGLGNTRVSLACLIDPVPRWWSNPFKSTWGAITGRAVGTIKLPPNVDRCLYWRQCQGAPYGRAVRCAEAWPDLEREGRIQDGEVKYGWEPDSEGGYLVPAVHVVDLRRIMSVRGTVYAQNSHEARLRSWEQGVYGQPPSHNEIDSYPAVRHAITQQVLGLLHQPGPVWPVQE